MTNYGRSQVRGARFYSRPTMRRFIQQPNLRHDHKELKPPMTNFDRFLKHTTPIVTARHLPKTSLDERRNDECIKPYFVLNDLWESFREWSAYGAGVPLLLNKSQFIQQFYAPYLSAVQLYVDPSTPLTNIMRPDEQSVSDSSIAASSDGSSCEGGAVGPELCAQENNIDSIAPGLLAFEFLENISWLHRSPFAQRAREVAAEFPELGSYRSCDLTPSSWFSVAWYPIYGIPVGPSLHIVDSCFLTYHSLSTLVGGTHDGTSCVCGPTISLPTFGLTACNFKPSDWIEDTIHGMEKVNSLIQSTDNWLRRLGVNHPDYVFFKDNPPFELL